MPDQHPGVWLPVQGPPSHSPGRPGQVGKPQAGWADTHKAALWHSESTFIYKALYKYSLRLPTAPCEVGQ